MPMATSLTRVKAQMMPWIPPSSAPARAAISTPNQGLPVR